MHCLCYLLLANNVVFQVHRIYFTMIPITCGYILITFGLHHGLLTPCVLVNPDIPLWRGIMKYRVQ